jgi:hypothetical protein
MPIDRHGLDPHTLDGVLSLDLDRGSATVDLGRVGFVDAYALTARLLHRLGGEGWAARRAGPP